MLAIAGDEHSLLDEGTSGLVLSEGMTLVGGYLGNEDPLVIPTENTTIIHGSSAEDGTSPLHVLIADAHVESHEISLLNLTITGGRAEGNSGEDRFGGGLVILYSQL